MKALKPAQRQFIKNLENLTQDYGVDLFLSKQRSVKLPGGDNRSNGYFSDETGKKVRLAVATRQDLSKWFAVLLHESSHMDQWHEKSLYWDYSAPGDPEIYTRWLGRGQFKTKESVQKAYSVIDKLLLLEADCEIRSAKKIKKLKLEVDYADYCQKANAYIYFYQAMKYTRAWYDIGYEPYNIASIVEAMPKTMLKNPEDYLFPSKKLLRLYFEHYPQKIAF